VGIKRCSRNQYVQHSLSIATQHPIPYPTNELSSKVTKKNQKENNNQILAKYFKKDL